MTVPAKIVVIPGDGVGPEVMAEACKVLDWLGEHGAFPFEIIEGGLGAATYFEHGVMMTDETLEAILSADAVLFGAIGGPEYDKIPPKDRRGRGLLYLRRKLDLFANLRPIKVMEPLLNASTLKPEVIKDVDLVVVRELTGGIYFGKPRGIEDLPGGGRRGINTQVYTTEEIRRVAAAAFELARGRRGRVCSVEKSNVMESGQLWREEVTALHEESFSDVELSHMLADNCAMQLIRDPKQFDVIVTDNLFGDILSDCAAMIAGSLGMLPSASLGVLQENGKRNALYEPVHGSAPDIAGKNVANPLAMIQSVAMMLRFSFQLDSEAALIEAAVADVLEQGLRTADILEAGATKVSTSEMGDAVVAALQAGA